MENWSLLLYLSLLSFHNIVNQNRKKSPTLFNLFSTNSRSISLLHPKYIIFYSTFLMFGNNNKNLFILDKCSKPLTFKEGVLFKKMFLKVWLWLNRGGGVHCLDFSKYYFWWAPLSATKIGFFSSLRTMLQTGYPGQRTVLWCFHSTCWVFHPLEPP